MDFATSSESVDVGEVKVLLGNAGRSDNVTRTVV